MIVNITVKDEYVDKLRDGYPLLSKEFINNWNIVQNEGSLLNLYDTKKRFIAKAYHGIQNKGYGWILTLDKSEAIDEAFFKERFMNALQYRKEFFEDKETTAFRVFNGEGDGVGGLTIDYFNTYYLITWYSIGIYELKDKILSALKQSVDYKGIYQKKRFESKGKYLDDHHDFILGEQAPAPLIVKENGANFAIYLDDGAMVGVFLDQRNVRKIIRDKYAKNKTILNTFSYTGAFSVFAALGGATQTTSVDLAKRSLSKTKEQFIVNDIDTTKHTIIVEDVFQYFKYALRKKLFFDIVVVDPPSFARSKKHTFSANKDYVKLLKEVILITSSNGMVVASTNSANFSMMTFHDFIAKAFKELKLKYRVIESFSLPKDFKVSDKFKESNYLKVVFIRKIHK